MYRYFYFLPLFILSLNSNAQSCFPEGIIFSTQQQIDRFPIDYPNCTVIEGDVCIGDCSYPFVDSDIVNLNGLLQLTSIKGNISITSNKNLTSLQGLRNLTTIEKDLTIQNNDLLPDFKGLEKIRVIGGTFNITGNNKNLRTTGIDSLQTIRGSLEFAFGLFYYANGFRSLDSIYGDFYITQTDQSTLEHFSSLVYLGGSLILSNTNLERLTGMSNLKAIGRNLTITNNSQLQSLSGLNSLKKISGDLKLSDNEDLGSITPLASVKEIGGSISMSHTWYIRMTDLSGLERVGGSISYSSNHLVNYVDGMNKVKFIGGSIIITGNHYIESIGGFRSLDTLIGNFQVSSNPELVEIIDMDSLKVIQGEFRFNNNKYLKTWEAPTRMKYFGGLDISTNDSFQLQPFPLLTNEVHGDIIIKQSPNVRRISGFENIERIHGTLEINLNSNLSTIDAFHQLKFVGNDLYLSNPNLDTLHGLTLVDTVGGDLNSLTNHAIQEFPWVNRFSHLGGVINIFAVDSLKDLSIFENLDSIYGNLVISACPNLTRLTGLSHLPYLGGGLKLYILPGITNLNDLLFLKGINGDLEVSILQSLTDLKGLDSLTRLNGKLRITSNNNLLSLEGIHNIDPQSITSTSQYAKEIIIQNNTKLSACSLGNLCEALRVYKKTFTISNNDPGCNDVRELDCRDYGLSGTVFFDANQNKQHDTLEFGVPGINILMEPGAYHIQSDEDGIYLQEAIPGQAFTMKLDAGPDWILTTDSSEYNPTFSPGLPSNKKYDFGIYPAFTKEAIDINLVSDPTRCNSKVNFYLRYVNTGTQVFNGKLKFILDQNTAYISSDDYPDQLSSSTKTYTWFIQDLQPFQHHDIKVVVDMPDENDTGDSMRFTMIVNKNVSGQDIIVSQQLYTPVVLCSFDPNDKIVTPQGLKDEGYVLFGDTLQYTIRFQNKGNAAAIDITIRDTIDVMFDMSTFTVVHSSFPVKTTIDANIVEFFFPNIWLPDSLSNEAASHGFVTYRIRTKPGINEFTAVHNEAHIVFDANPPIVTNQTTNTFVSSLCWDVVEQIDTIICEGMSYMGHESTGIYYDTISIGNICDSITILDVWVLEKYENTWNLKFCYGTEYTISGHPYIADTTKTFVDTSYYWNGCLSNITTVNLEVTHPADIVIDTSICLGNEFEGYETSGTYTYEQYNSSSNCTDQVTLHLNVFPVEIVIDTTICEGRNYLGWFEPGTYTYVRNNHSTGCEEHITVNIEVKPAPEITLDTTLCEGQDYYGYNETGTYEFFMSNPFSQCPDQVTLHLIMLPAEDPQCITDTDEEPQTSLRVYPNPGSGIFYIKSDAPVRLLDIISLDGIPLHDYQTQIETDGLRLTIDQELADNIYLIRMVIEGKVYCHKIVMQ